jgi:UDP-N-acetylmuramoylalanine-D-glutamate ligase
MIRVTAFNDRRVAVFGLGASGIASARALAAGGARVAAWDDSAPSRDAAANAVTLWRPLAEQEDPERARNKTVTWDV